MPTHAAGNFEVKLEPQGEPSKAEGSTRGRMSINKQFQGDLEAASVGEMLTALTDVNGSAGYVAIEQVTGSLHGKKGSFFLQHSGIITRGAQQLVINIVPDSGSAELRGIAGTMSIQINDGQHRYEMEYTLEDHQ